MYIIYCDYIPHNKFQEQAYAEGTMLTANCWNIWQEFLSATELCSYL